MVPRDPDVRRATADDLESLVATLVSSHVDYVWESWALPYDDRAARLQVLYRHDLSAVALPHGEVIAARDGASVAVWLPAGVGERLDAADVAALDAVATKTFGERRAVVEEVSRAVAGAAPRHVDWHLATMGTDPAAQRRGLGTAVLTPMLDQLDRSRATAGLETSATENVRFYERLGFVVVAALTELPHGAPPVWIMERPPD